MAQNPKLPQRPKGPKIERSRARPGLALQDESLLAGWSHVAAKSGKAESRMVDVSKKPITRREARARAILRFPAGLLDLLWSGKGPKGPVLEMARAAGILAAKRTGELIPLCHPLGLDAVDVSFKRDGRDRLLIETRAANVGRTGVEMEAMTAAALAALTVYDMSKARSHAIELEQLCLLEKRGGRSGRWVRPETAGGRAASAARDA